MMVLALQFLLLPSSAQVGVFPSKAVAGLGNDVVFTCTSFSSPILERVDWLINDTSLNDGHRSDGVTQERDALQFSNVSAEYNNTRIQCIGHNVTSPEPATLLVQGLLAAVGSLLVNAGMDHLYVNWTAPFTLDITLSPVDITYCVDVVSSTSSATLHSECGITETGFTYPLPPRSWCHEYNFTVTPVNVAGNGTKNNLLYFQDLSGPHLMEVNVGSSDVSVIMSAPVCQAELRAVDLHTKEYYILRRSDVTVSGTNISFPFELLQLNRLYSLMVLANNTGGKNLSEGMISTHDITNCVIYNDTTITAEFAEHSEATGALLKFIFHENGVINFSKSICLIVDKTNISQGLTLPVDMWYPGQYMYFAYDIESDKRILDGVQYQANRGYLNVTHGKAGSPSPTSVKNCSVDSYAGVITVACSFLFQVTAQRNTLDSVNILHVKTSMDPHTPVTLQVTENGEYLVTILPVQDGRGIMSSEVQAQTIIVTDITTQSPVSSIPTISPSIDVTGILVGTVVCLLCLTVMVVIVVVMILKTRHKAFKKSENVYVEAQISERSDSITVRMSRSGPSTTTASQDDEPAYAMVQDVDPDVHSYSPADVEESVHIVVQQGKESQSQILTAIASEKKPNKNPLNPHTVLSHPPPSYNSVIVPPPGDQETSAPTTPAIPVYTNVDLSPKRLASGTSAVSFQSENTVQSKEESNKSLAASHPTPDHGQSCHSAAGHYVALDNHKKAASSDVINVHHTSSEYAIPAGFRNKQNQTYAFVELKEGRDKQHELEVINDVEKVVYAELAPQTRDEDKAPLCY